MRWRNHTSTWVSYIVPLESERNAVADQDTPREAANGGSLPLSDDFDDGLSSRWYPLRQGRGIVRADSSVLRMELPAGEQGRYSNAQIDDYGRPLTARFLWRPPLHLEVRARSSLPVHPPSLPSASIIDGPDRGVKQDYLVGTAGFGFWNRLLSLGAGRPSLPEAVWFLAASPPSDMALVPGIPGWGWKAQVVHAQRWSALWTGVPTLATVGWTRLTGRGETIAAHWLHRFTGAAEAHLIPPLNEWHEYQLDWQKRSARFYVDGAEVLNVPDPPRGPLGFVAWIDNQYAIITPRGSVGSGSLASGPEWLDIDWLRIVPG
jgi:hypothetical protein